MRTVDESVVHTSVAKVRNMGTGGGGPGSRRGRGNTRTKLISAPSWLDAGR